MTNTPTNGLTYIGLVFIGQLMATDWCKLKHCDKTSRPYCHGCPELVRQWAKE